MSEVALRYPTLEASDGGQSWVELARRSSDGIVRILRTLGERAMADTPARVDISASTFEIHQQGPLSEVAPIYLHPTLYVSAEEAQAAFESS